MAKLCRRDRVFNRRYHSQKLNEHKFAIEESIHEVPIYLRFLQDDFLLYPHHWQVTVDVRQAIA